MQQRQRVMPVRSKPATYSFAKEKRYLPIDRTTEATHLLHPVSLGWRMRQMQHPGTIDCRAALRDIGPMAEVDLTQLNLDVYDTRDGPWNPEHGTLAIPDDWHFLPSGDAFLTRTVKAVGVYWVAWRPRGRNRPAPTQTRAVGTHQGDREGSGNCSPDRQSAGARTPAGARQRAYDEDRYRVDLEAAIVDFLGFHAAHNGLAAEIADGAARQAAAVGRGRVARTQTLPLEERAALAARAWIRHRHTDYEDRLDTTYGDDTVLDELTYRAFKSMANQAVDDFIAAHRAGQ